MTDDAPDDDFLDLVQQGWIADYPPWFAEFWIKPAKCKTAEQASQLLHLLRSIEDGKTDDTRRLLPGIDPNVRLAVEGRRSESLLEWAVEKAGRPECIHILIEAGASLDSPSLVHKLVTARRTDLLRTLLAAGADPNGKCDGETALAAACWNDPKAVQLLLASGARTNVTTTIHVTNKKKVSKVTPLMVAAYAGQTPIVKLLLDAGSKVDAVDAAGNTAFAWAKAARAKAQGAKIAAMLEKAGATAQADTGALPEPVDFAARAKTPQFKQSLKIAKELTKSAGKPVELAEGPLAGASAFRIRKAESAAALLDEIRPQAAALGALAFLSENLYEMAVSYLVLVPTADYREAIVAFETPAGQSIDSYELVAWLEKLEKTQPFSLTHLAPDLVRAKFTTAIKNSKKLAKAIEKICPDVINTSLANVAKHLEKSQELYLWWD
jgi:hypothetical protein